MTCLTLVSLTAASKVMPVSRPEQHEPRSPRSFALFVTVACSWGCAARGLIAFSLASRTIKNRPRRPLRVQTHPCGEPPCPLLFLLFADSWNFWNGEPILGVLSDRNHIACGTVRRFPPIWESLPLGLEARWAVGNLEPQLHVPCCGDQIVGPDKRAKCGLGGGLCSGGSGAYHVTPYLAPSLKSSWPDRPSPGSARVPRSEQSQTGRLADLGLARGLTLAPNANMPG